MKLSIIIPVYNEEQTIGEVIERVWMVNLGGLDREVIIANDGSSDGTRHVIDASPWINDPRVKTYNSPINLGKGAAVRLGLAFATGDILLVQDADLELDPNEYGRLLAPILDGRADIVYGSRFLAPSGRVAFRRRLANRCLTMLTNLLFGSRLTDMETASSRSLETLSSAPGDRAGSFPRAGFGSTSPQVSICAPRRDRREQFERRADRVVRD